MKTFLSPNTTEKDPLTKHCGVKSSERNLQKLKEGIQSNEMQTC